MPHPELDPDITAYYERGHEHDRLTSAPSLELIRTRELLRRLLPARCSVLDVGGATGVYAGWLAARGHRVHLIDPVASQVDTAAGHGGFTAEVGDARALPVTDASYDATLLFGPLYHLLERADRLTALREAVRVTRPGGIVLATAISRWASLFELLHARGLDRELATMVRTDLAGGQRRGTLDKPHGFTTTHFHRPEELTADLHEAGLAEVDVFAVEGPATRMPEVATHLADPASRALILEFVRAVEREPSVLGASEHLLAHARR